MTPHADRALLVRVPTVWAEITGALLFDALGPYEEREEARMTALLFYPERYGGSLPSREGIVALLPDDPELRGGLSCEEIHVAGGWEDNWRNFFVPLDIGPLRVRPPWEPPAPPHSLDVCINPGLAFGTGLHETTRGVLQLLLGKPWPPAGPGGRPDGWLGPFVDAGCGSGILSIAASRLGYGPIKAFDADPLAVEAARANCVGNGVEVDVVQATVAEADLVWFGGATVAANIAEKPVLELLSRLAGAAPGSGPRRLLAGGLLQGRQERAVLARAVADGWELAETVWEGGWVTLDLVRGSGAAGRAARHDVAS